MRVSFSARGSLKLNYRSAAGCDDPDDRGYPRVAVLLPQAVETEKTHTGEDQGKAAVQIIETSSFIRMGIFSHLLIRVT